MSAAVANLPELTEKQQVEVLNAFNNIDTDGNGILDCSESLLVYAIPILYYIWVHAPTCLICQYAQNSYLAGVYINYYMKGGTPS